MLVYTVCIKIKGNGTLSMLFYVNYSVYERNFFILKIGFKLLNDEFLYHFEQKSASVNRIKIASRKHMCLITNENK